MKCLFEVKDGRATITNHTRLVWFYNEIIEKWGEQIATKIFTVYHYMADLSLDNPWANVSELDKLETIISAICPELVLEVDWNDPIILEGIEYTRKLYETPSYRKYLAVKVLADKATNTLHHSEINTSKESGNAGEISKTLSLFTALTIEAANAYKEYLEEQGAKRVRGKGTVSSTVKHSLPKNLD